MGIHRGRGSHDSRRFIAVSSARIDCFKVVCIALAVGASLQAAARAVSEPAIEVQFTEAVSPEFEGVAHRWVERAKRAVATYYGKFPVERLRIKITPRSGRRALRRLDLRCPTALAAQRSRTSSAGVLRSSAAGAHELASSQRI